ncbi:MAG: neutral zinc metallopeptidase [Pseudomonadota bacterium]
MRWQGRSGSSNVQDRRGAGMGRGVAGGGIGMLAIGVVVMLLGGDPTAFFTEGVSRTIQSRISPESRFSEPEQQEMVNFVSVVLAETEDTWGRHFQAQGSTYPQPSMIIFSGGTDSGCGFAQSAVGPFYCPLDQNVYIDLDFFYDLKTKLDAPGDFAQAYVIAHEVGHHIQNVLGVLEQAEQQKQGRSQTEANSVSVRTELMADCLAGVWAADANSKGLLEEGDIDEALNAASQIGDDTLQREAQGRVVPDSFTHGSAAQRNEWFKRGYQGAQLEVCNTFEANSL